jgi:hypothetical protein
MLEQKRSQHWPTFNDFEKAAYTCQIAFKNIELDAIQMVKAKLGA